MASDADSSHNNGTDHGSADEDKPSEASGKQSQNGLESHAGDSPNQSESKPSGGVANQQLVDNPPPGLSSAGNTAPVEIAQPANVDINQPTTVTVTKPKSPSPRVSPHRRAARPPSSRHSHVRAYGAARPSETPQQTPPPNNRKPKPEAKWDKFRHFISPPASSSEEMNEWRKSQQRTSVVVLGWITFVVVIALIVVNVMTFWLAHTNTEQLERNQDTAQMLKEVDAAIGQIQYLKNLKQQLSQPAQPLESAIPSSAETTSPSNPPPSTAAPESTESPDLIAIRQYSYDQSIASIKAQIDSINTDIANANAARPVYRQHQDFWNKFKTIMLAGSFVVFLILLAITFSFYLAQHHNFQYDYWFKQAQKGADPTETFQKQRESYANSLTAYQRIVLNYARTTRRATIIFIVLGFIGVAAVTGLTFWLADQDKLNEYVAGIISAASGALVAYIAQIVLTNAKSSSEELSGVFELPFQQDRVMVAREIINDNITEPKKSEAYEKVVESLLVPISTKSSKANTQADGTSSITPTPGGGT